jgi:hypothetical protein
VYGPGVSAGTVTVADVLLNETMFADAVMLGVLTLVKII